MSGPEKEKDFFISYTGADVNWATWIAETLENNGYTLIIQAWDFKAGGSFVNDMHRAIESCEKALVVMSEAYYKSVFCAPEWQSYFTDDPTGEKGLIIPVRIEKAKPQGLLKPRTYIDIFGIEEKEATKRLLDGVSAKPKVRISRGFPGGKTEPADTKTAAKFPGMPRNNLPARNVYFTGRVGLLDDIAKGFEQSGPIVLAQTVSGLGGVGKTQTAIEYAYRNAGGYELIWFFSAEMLLALKNAVDQFFKKVTENDISELKPEDTAERFRNWMEENGGWLFIFDNAEDYETLAPYLPRSNAGQGRVLVTSRNPFWDKTGRKPLDVVRFTPPEALAFLRSRTRITDDDEAALALADLLGGLPLALEYAAAYISENGGIFSDYVELYKKDRLELLNDGLTEEQKSIEKTFSISMDKIKNESARQLLNLCAYLAPDNIGLELLIAQNPYLPSPLKEEIADKRKRNRILHDLKSYSLIDEKSGILSVHHLLQEAVRSCLKDDATYLNACFRYLDGQSKSRDYTTLEGREKARTFLPHAVSIYEALETAEMEERHYLSFLIADCFDEFASYEQAIEYYIKALTVQEKVLGKEHPDTAGTYNNIAVVHKNKGDYNQALEWHNKALAIKEKVLGKEHPDTAGTYNNIAVVYKNQGNYDKALEWFGKALAVKEKVLGKEHPDTAMTYNNIAVVYYNQGDYGNALEWYGKALAVKEKVLGKEHPVTARTYNNIAIVYKAQGDYSKALEWYGKALTVKEKVLGKEHPDTAVTYNNIAIVYKTQGDYGKAQEWYGKALAVREKVLGKEHPDTAATYNNIAVVYDHQGDYGKALEWYNKALSIFEKKLGPNHPYTIKVQNNIDRVKKQMNS